jgi:hypothetical protein
MTKRCSRCGEEKPVGEFTRQPGSADGLRSECRPCRAKTVREQRHREPERSIFTIMKQRCHNPHHPKFHLYGGRGITVCEEWRGPGGFPRFLDHIGPRPSPKHSVDRIDNARGYEPGNVRWATQREQMRNTRINHVVTAFGRSQCLAAWCEETGLHYRVILRRLNSGWPAETALSTPSNVGTRKECAA